MSDVTYHAVERLDRALAVLDTHRGDVLVVAGGTLAVPALRSFRPPHLLDISRLAELRAIAEEGSESLRFGALVTCTNLARSELVRRRAPVLAQAALNVGGPQIRNLATVGGNIATRCPRADLLPILLVLQATVTLRGRAHSRTLPLSALLKEGAREDELITSIACDAPRGAAVLKRLGARCALSPAIASVAVLLEGNAENNGWRRAHIALGGVAPTAKRAERAEAVLHTFKRGGDFTEVARRAGVATREEVDPADDAWASARYRRHVIAVLTERALLEAAREAGIA